MNEYYRIIDGHLELLEEEVVDVIVEGGQVVGYIVEPKCCACRWIKGYGECGHGESDGLTSPHIHCRDHAGRQVAR